MKKTLIALISATLLASSLCLPIMAAPVNCTTEVTCDTSASTYYTVSLPATLRLIRVGKTDEYKADIGGFITADVMADKKVYVRPQATEFTMTHATKQNVTAQATVEQITVGDTGKKVEEFTSSELRQLGRQRLVSALSVELTELGNYTGSVIVEYGLEDR